MFLSCTWSLSAGFSSTHAIHEQICTFSHRDSTRAPQTFCTIAISLYMPNLARSSTGVIPELRASGYGSCEGQTGHRGFPFFG